MVVREHVTAWWRALGMAEIIHNPRSATGQVALGRALLGICGLIVTTTVWALGTTPATGPTLAVVSAVLLAFATFCQRLPWHDGASRLPLLFPLGVVAALVAVALSDGHAAPAYTALLVLSFVYIGMTQRPLTSVAVAPLAALAWALMQDGWTAIDTVRLAISILVWLAVGELLSYRSDRAARDRARLFGAATTDALTGLLNRRALDTRLANAGPEDTVVMCDLDHFKALNDEQGHAAGDELLQRFGALLTESLRGIDVAGRYGGEEFVLLLVDTSPEAALDVIARMRTRWAALDPPVTFSCGIAAVLSDRSVAASLAAADSALYASKDAGRNCDHISYSQLVKAT